MLFGVCCAVAPMESGGAVHHPFNFRRVAPFSSKVARFVGERALSGVAAIIGFSWHGSLSGPRVAEDDEVEELPSEPDWHHLHELSRNASLVYCTPSMA